MHDHERFPTPVNSNPFPPPRRLYNLHSDPPSLSPYRADKEVASTPSGSSGFWRGPPGEKDVWTLRITRRRFWILVAIALLLVGAIVGGAVGGTLAVKNRGGSAATTSGSSITPGSNPAQTTVGGDSGPTPTTAGDPTAVQTQPSAATSTPPAIIVDGNANFSYFDCLGEPKNGRALLYRVEGEQPSMTVERCLAECYRYKFAGLEYGQECWCADEIGEGTFLHDTGCNMTCKGNSSEVCGGNIHLTTYQYNATKAALNKGGS